MFDKTYFEMVFPKQVSDMGGNGTKVILKLHYGEVYALREILETGETCLRAAIHPPEAFGESPKDVGAEYSKRRKDREGNRIHDQIAVPYSVISHLHFTTRESERNSGMGFHVP